MWKKCPCCGENFTLSDYLFREKKNEECEDESREKRCKSCDSPVLLGREKNSYGVLTFLLLSFIYYLLDLPLTLLSIFIVFGFIFIVSTYIEYKYIALKCYKEEDVVPYWKEDWSDQHWMIGLIVIAFFITILYLFISASQTYKERKMAWQINKDSNITKDIHK